MQKEAGSSRAAKINRKESSKFPANSRHTFLASVHASSSQCFVKSIEDGSKRSSRAVKTPLHAVQLAEDIPLSIEASESNKFASKMEEIKIATTIFFELSNSRAVLLCLFFDG